MSSIFAGLVPATVWEEVETVDSPKTIITKKSGKKILLLN